MNEESTSLRKSNLLQYWNWLKPNHTFSFFFFIWLAVKTSSIIIIFIPNCTFLVRLGRLIEPCFVFWRDVFEPKYPWRDQTSLCAAEPHQNGTIRYFGKVIVISKAYQVSDLGIAGYQDSRPGLWLAIIANLSAIMIQITKRWLHFCFRVVHNREEQMYRWGKRMSE